MASFYWWSIEWNRKNGIEDLDSKIKAFTSVPISKENPLKKKKLMEARSKWEPEAMFYVACGLCCVLFNILFIFYT